MKRTELWIDELAAEDLREGLHAIVENLRPPTWKAVQAGLADEGVHDLPRVEVLHGEAGGPDLGHEALELHVRDGLLPDQQGLATDLSCGRPPTSMP